MGKYVDMGKKTQRSKYIASLQTCAASLKVKSIQSHDLDFFVYKNFRILKNCQKFWKKSSQVIEMSSHDFDFFF